MSDELEKLVADQTAFWKERERLEKEQKEKTKKVATEPQKHTPGPWKVTKDGFGVETTEGRQIILARHGLAYWDDEEMAANANLIAAAPALLSACKGLMLFVPSSKLEWLNAEAAIAAATKTEISTDDR